jgi:hypothetical protein
MRLTRIVPITIAALAAAACTSGTPTGVEATRWTAPGGPHLSGGVMYGSGNRSVMIADSFRVLNGTAASTLVVSAAGGVMYGSGN